MTVCTQAKTARQKRRKGGIQWVDLVVEAAVSPVVAVVASPEVVAAAVEEAFLAAVAASSVEAVVVMAAVVFLVAALPVADVMTAISIIIPAQTAILSGRF